MKKTLLKLIAGYVASAARYHDSDVARHEEFKDLADDVCRQFLPSGSGFDAGTSIDWDRTKENQIVLLTQFHHMNEGGYYDGWTQHAVKVKPDFVTGFTVTVSGKNRNDIKDYIGDTFHETLRQEIDVSYDQASGFYRYALALESAA